jgi:hypothetical protein
MLPEGGREGVFVTRQMWLNKDCRLVSGAGLDRRTTGVGFSDGCAALGVGALEHPVASAQPAAITTNKIAATPFRKNIFPHPVSFIVL